MSIKTLSKLGAVTFAAGLLLRAASGCSSSDPKGDLCVFAHDTNNCWRKLTASISTCMKGRGTIDGKFSADGTTCASTDGRYVVTFTTPVDLTKPDDRRDRDFIITVDGAQCTHVLDVASSSPHSLVVFGPDGTKVTSDGGGITCPDGKGYNGDPFATLQKCADVLFNGGLPGDSYSGDTKSDAFALLGSGAAGYTCSK